MRLFFAASMAIGLLMATTAMAEVHRPPAPASNAAVSGATQTLSAPSIGRSESIGQAHPLFNLGKVPVVVWSPVLAPYDSHMNRTLAESPLSREAGNAF